MQVRKLIKSQNTKIPNFGTGTNDIGDASHASADALDCSTSRPWKNFHLTM